MGKEQHAQNAGRKKRVSAEHQALKDKRSIGETISHHRNKNGNEDSGIDSTFASDPDDQQGDALSPAHASNTNLRVARYAKRTARTVGQHSSAFDVRKEIAFPRFKRQEVILGKKLGRGGFSNVYEVVRFELEKNSAGLDEEPMGCPVGGVVEDSKKALSKERSGKKDENDDDDDDDDIPTETLNNLIRRVSRKSFKGLEDSDEDEIVHPTLQRGQSAVGFKVHHTKARSFLAAHCIRDAKSKNEPKTPRYAIKRLRPDVMEDEDSYMMGAADLVVEARFLACLEHPNIVKMRGMPHSDVAAFSSGVEGDYFLIMDRLSETLESRIQTWRKKAKRYKHKVMGSVLDRKGNKMRNHLASRIEVAYEIGNALKYLHEKNIIFRDLKPENIGFDVRGDVKLFDFGMAKELRDGERVQEERRSHPSLRGNMCTDTYEMSAPCGSYRYMAPEVIRAQPYNLSVDTYSFAVMLYELCVLKKPYFEMGREELIQRVSVENYRPELPTEGRNALPNALRNYITLAWSDNLLYRPDMETTCGTLWKILEPMKEGSAENGGPDQSAYDRRRSTFVMQKPSFGNLVGTSMRILNVSG